MSIDQQSPNSSPSNKRTLSVGRLDRQYRFVAKQPRSLESFDLWKKTETNQPLLPTSQPPLPEKPPPLNRLIILNNNLRQKELNGERITLLDKLNYYQRVPHLLHQQVTSPTHTPLFFWTNGRQDH